MIIFLTISTNTCSLHPKTVTLNLADKRSIPDNQASHKVYVPHNIEHAQTVDLLILSQRCPGPRSLLGYQRTINVLSMSYYY